MNTVELVLENDLNKLCIPIRTAVSAKFRGAFCEALVNSVDKIILCRIQLLDSKKTVKVNAEDIIGKVSTNSRVQVKLPQCISNGIILKIIDNSIYHVVFNDGDTGKLRRNQLVLKGDRHYKESESLDKHPLTNPEHFTKAVIYDKRSKDKSDIEEDEFDNDDQKSCSQESLITVSSNKTRLQQTHNSSPLVGTGGSSLAVKTSDELSKTPMNKMIKFKKHANTKYLIGCLVVVNRVVRKLASVSSEKVNKKSKAFIGLIVSPTSCVDEDNPDIKTTQCVIKSFLDNFWYVVYKRDLDLVVKRDMLIKHKELNVGTSAYIEKCLLFFDAKIYPDLWDSDTLLYSGEYSACDSTDRSITKSNVKSRLHSSLTNSRSSLTSSSSDEGNPDNGKSDSSDQDYQNTKDEWVARFYGFWEDKGSPINHGLEIQGVDVDIYHLFELVKEFGGFQKVNTSVRWPHLYHLLKLPHSTSENYQRLQTLYKKFIYPYVDMKKKLGTFEQSRIRKFEKSVSSSQKARPLLSARERREYVRQSNRKITEAHSVSSQSVCERPIDHGTSGDEIGTNSLVEDNSQLSQCSSSPKPMFDRNIEGELECKSVPTTCVNRLSPGTIISVAYGDKKVYKAKIIQQHSPENKSLKSASLDSRNTSKILKTSLDSLSNADSASSTTNNDFKSDIDSSTFYKVHYIGWNSRHDEIISPERILGVISDTGMDNQSTCSSCRQKPTISDTEQVIENVNNVLQQESCNDVSEENIIDEFLNSNINKCSNSNEMVQKELVDIPVEQSIPATEQFLENMGQQEETDMDFKPIKSINLKRRRSKSACNFESGFVAIKKLPILLESRTIASLNLYHPGDKMPMPPKRMKHEETLNDSDQMIENQLKEEVKSPLLSYKCENESQQRHSICTNDDDISSTNQKEEYIALEPESDDMKFYFKPERNTSPSFSNDSLSDASTIPFNLEQDQSLFYLTQKDVLGTSQISVARSALKTGNKRGRKPIFRPERQISSTRTPGKINRDLRSDIVEIESTSSQQSGSAHGRRVTRSLRNLSDQNTIDDNSIQFEDDSQTSQDDSAFQLPTVLPLDIRSNSMIPLAAGTPTLYGQKGRRLKSRRKNRNSMSTSSADAGYQDSNGEATTVSDIVPATDCNIQILAPENDNNNGMPPSRSFQRLHPSLIPVGLEKLPPEERVKLLESVIRQTHLNFLDVKDKIRFVERQLQEIKLIRASGHGIESDEDKFR